MGFIVVAVYTGFGIASWPITLMKGARPLDEEAVQIRRRRMEIEQRRTGSSHSPDPDLDVANNTLSRQERELERLSSNRFLRYCNLAMRPFEMVAGLGLLGVGLLVFISLLLTNIDRSLNSLGMRSGYALTKRTLPNPLESVLMQAEAYFPFNLALFGAFVIYLVFATMNGVRRIGIRVCGIKLYRIRAHRTRPQGVLLLCTILIFAVLALNMLVYMLAPTYVTFGSQRYIGGVDGHYGNLFDQHWYAEVDGKLINCDLNGVPGKLSAGALPDQLAGGLMAVSGQRTKLFHLCGELYNFLQKVPNFRCNFFRNFQISRRGSASPSGCPWLSAARCCDSHTVGQRR